jgi:2-dehydro-3-deoxygluconokinase
MSQSKVVVFGEVMMRLAAPSHRRFVQVSHFDVAYTGAEANVAVSLQNFGLSTYLVSRVPDNDIGQSCINYFRQYGINTEAVQRGGSRLGLFYLETGASQRASKVVYDRANSAITELRPGDIAWGEIFDGKHWLHLSGSAPALSKSMADVTLEACRMAKEKGVTVSVDLNFRNKLWKWDPAYDSRDLARKTMKEILKYVDVIIGNEEDAFDVLGVRAGDTNVNAGHLDIDRYPQVAAEIKKQFPQLSHIAFTLRESVSASHNNWGAMLYEADSGTCHFAPTVDGRYKPYAITHIVDRVGGGDSFSGGLIYSLLQNMPACEAVAFAAAASCLKHSIPGDFNLVSVQDVMALVGGNASGRVQR